MTTRTGGCLCGAVRFEVTGEPHVAGACYCRDCQYTSGGGAAYGEMYPADAVSVTRGELRDYVSRAESGSDVHRLFCPACGTHLISYNSANQRFRAIKPGTLDDPSGFRSQGSLWTRSAQPWHRMPDDVPSWETQPCLEEI